jgi:hypothetical protein
MAADGGRQLALHLRTELVDVVHPMAVLFHGRRMLDQQEVLHDLTCHAVDRVALALAQVPDLLGDVREVEWQVGPRPGEATELRRLALGPGVEVGIVELAGRGWAHGDVTTESAAMRATNHRWLALSMSCADRDDGATMVDKMLVRVGSSR